jgi:hypothetical protein
MKEELKKCKEANYRKMDQLERYLDLLIQELERVISQSAKKDVLREKLKEDEGRP